MGGTGAAPEVAGRVRRARERAAQEAKLVRMRSARAARKARWRHVRREVDRHQKRLARGKASTVRAAPRAWQRFFVIPVMTVWEGLTSLCVWASEALRRPPARILSPLPEGEFLVVGHRGAPAREVENTIPAFERALAEGANAIETDLCVTKDGYVVVWHDWDPDELVAFARQSGAEFDVRCRPVVPPEGHPSRKPICEITLAEFMAAYGYADVGGHATLPVRVPLLADVVAWAASRPGLRAVFLDVKVPPARKELVHVIRRTLETDLAKSPGAAQWIYLSPHEAVVAELVREAPDVARSFDVEVPPGLPAAAETISAVRPAIAHGHPWASIGRPRFTLGGWPLYGKILAADLTTMAERASGDGPPRRLVCWTINRPREMRHLLRMGVHGILTDVPESLRRQMARVKT